MPNEIERKFIVSHIPNDLANKKITQGYLQSEKHRTVRIRIFNDSSNNETAYLTIKGKSNRAGTSRYEFEIQIPINEATHLIEMCDKPLICTCSHRIKSLPYFYNPTTKCRTTYISSTCNNNCTLFYACFF